MSLIDRRSHHWLVEWFKRYRENERSECFNHIVQSWDTPTRRPSSVISACARRGGSKARTSSCSPSSAGGSSTALKRAVREQQNLFEANVVLIEDKASPSLIQELIADGCHGSRTVTASVISSCTAKVSARSRS